MTTPPDEHKLTEQPELLIDSHGMPYLLAAFAEIAHSKSEHVQTNWQDKQLAAAWTRISRNLSKLGCKTPRL